jgi:peptide/nickel transport system permease protein
LIGLLDSIHFHPREETGATQAWSTEIISVFDWVMTPLRERVEKTYSAPFATHLYAKETIEGDDGLQRRDYPRLKFGGVHLTHPVEQRGRDILITGFTGFAEGLGLWGIALLMVGFWRARSDGESIPYWFAKVLQGKCEMPWFTFLMTLALMFVLICISAELSLKYHVLGTDKVGQDVMYQALKSIRTGLLIGTLTTLVMLPLALSLGITAGYFRGWVDDLIQFIYTTLNSIPSVLLIAAAILIVQVYMSQHEAQFTSLALRADMRLLFLCLILGITTWTGLCRLLRAETLKLREMDYVQAAYAFGVGHGRILLRHVLPNLMHIVLISIVLDFSALVLAEAVLSYVNIGVDPTMSSWGNMINSARLEMAREPIVWWSLTAAFVFMFAFVLSANLFADAVRDAFDPRIRS